MFRFPLSCVSLSHYSFQDRFKPYKMSELFKDQGIELVIWSKMRDFFLNKYCLTNYFDTIL